MRQPTLHSLDGRVDDCLRRSKVRIPYLQADNAFSGRLHGIDSVGHGNGGGLAQTIELLV